VHDTLPIGEVASRAGVATSALRFYEHEGLIHAVRSSGGQRRYHRDVLRRVAFIRVAQRVGLSLADIKAALATLPEHRTPNATDWERLSASWLGRLTDQIDLLVRLRDQLTSCIGCGCLSFKVCKLYNPGDVAASLGDGPRYLLGNRASDVQPTDVPASCSPPIDPSCGPVEATPGP